MPFGVTEATRTTNNPSKKLGENRMAQRKESKKTIKVRDLKPKKDAKGGQGPKPNRPDQIQGHQMQRPGRGGS
jgi:hypothetical protein